MHHQPEEPAHHRVQGGVPDERAQTMLKDLARLEAKLVKTRAWYLKRMGKYLSAAKTLRFAQVAEDDRRLGPGAVLALRVAQRDELLALFDRTEAYAQWRDTATLLQSELHALGETEARRRWRAVAVALHGLQRIDYFPGAAADQARSELDTLRQALDARFSKGEPRPQVDHGIEWLDARKFQGKRWATRARPWVDRLASAWLIRRFIDTQARFIWLSDPAASPAPAPATTTTPESQSPPPPPAVRSV